MGIEGIGSFWSTQSKIGWRKRHKNYITTAWKLLCVLLCSMTRSMSVRSFYTTAANGCLCKMVTRDGHKPMMDDAVVWLSSIAAARGQHPLPMWPSGGWPITSTLDFGAPPSIDIAFNTLHLSPLIYGIYCSWWHQGNVFGTIYCSWKVALQKRCFWRITKSARKPTSIEWNHGRASPTINATLADKYVSIF